VDLIRISSLHFVSVYGFQLTPADVCLKTETPCKYLGLLSALPLTNIVSKQTQMHIFPAVDTGHLLNLLECDHSAAELHRLQHTTEISDSLKISDFVQHPQQYAYAVGPVTRTV